MLNADVAPSGHAWNKCTFCALWCKFLDNFFCLGVVVGVCLAVDTHPQFILEAIFVRNGHH